MAAVSVIMPAFNAAPYIGAAIESVLSQTMADWELIVVDDGSTDATVDIARRYAAADRRVRVLAGHEPSGSPAATRLLGLREVASDWVFPLDADDIIGPDFLSLMMSRQAATGADAVLCRLDKFEGEPAAAQPFLPAGSFNTSAVYSGRDLLTATLNGWTIPANGIFRCDSYSTISGQIVARIPRNQYADEHIGRMVIHSARRVAFSPARYFYRMHSGSVTHRASARRFGFLDTNLLLDGFVRRADTPDSTEVAAVQTHVYKALVGALIDLGRSSRLDAADRAEVDTMLRDSYRAIDFGAITVRGPIFRIMRLGLRPARLILSAYGRLRR